MTLSFDLLTLKTRQRQINALINVLIN